MYSEETIRIVERFQERFSRTHADDIRRLINQSYAEALQQARKLLRQRALRQILAHSDRLIDRPNATETNVRKEPLSNAAHEIPPPISTTTPVDDELERPVARASDDGHVEIEESEELPDSPSPSSEFEG